ncbi:MAG: hypothetical protein H0W71_08910 [Sphingomonas sp.]|nr:hypothetical protein [Sphingomonas sp.]
MSGWCIKTATPDIPGEPMVQLFVVNDSDMENALRIVADTVDKNVDVIVAGPVSARSIEIFGIAPGKMRNVTT